VGYRALGKAFLVMVMLIGLALVALSGSRAGSRSRRRSGRRRGRGRRW
jgi:Tfp pilus assembly protein PilX